MRNPSKFNPINRERGYILPFVLVLLMILLLSSAAFFNRASITAQISGQQRDTTQALLLAESVINRVQGRFLSGASDETPMRTDINDINADGNLSPDFKQIKDLIPTVTSVPAINSLPYYIYYIPNGPVGTPSRVAVSTTSRILQAVANGESTAANSNLAINGQQIGATTRIKVSELFVDANRHPLAYVVNAAGIPILSEGASAIDTTAEWNAASAALGRAAVWLELAADTANEQIHLYIATMAQVGSTKAYLQRYIGPHDYSLTLGDRVAPISESGNRF